MRNTVTAAAVVAALLLAGCGAAPVRPRASAPPRSSSPRPGASAVLAFAGDVHFEGTSASTTDLGDAFSVLAGADVAEVNLETAVTTGGQAAPKQFTFRAPPRALVALHGAGVDAVSLANNHGMDYGRAGLADTLAAARAAHLQVLGAGDDARAAYAPWRVDPHGVPVSIFAATDVLDAFATTTWPAGPHTSGLASVKEGDRLVTAVRAEAARGRVVVVVLHWGVERTVCPTPRQQVLARELTGAGADVVVGSHAHVLQPQVRTVGALVAYGLGNFHFYARPGPGSATGVLTVDVDRSGVTGSRWHPATITDGRPQLATGVSAQQRAGELGQLCPAASGTSAP